MGAQDEHPHSYSLSVNINVIREENWAGEDIIVPLVSWGIGTYEVALKVQDESSNVAKDTIQVEITNLGSSKGGGFTNVKSISVLLGFMALIFYRRKK